MCQVVKADCGHLQMVTSLFNPAFQRVKACAMCSEVVSDDVDDSQHIKLARPEIVAALVKGKTKQAERKK